LADKITVPFCPESTLSGIGETDYLNAVWYRRVVTVPQEWAGAARLRLHFQACDYDTTVWANGVEIARHRGGFTPFRADLPPDVRAGDEVVIVVRARDDHRQGKPQGKQSTTYANSGVHYTRTTGIWQTVWLEPLPETFMERPRITPDVAGSRFRITLPLAGQRRGCTLRARLADAAGLVSEAAVAADADFAPTLDLTVPAARRQLWEPGTPHLYEIELTLQDAAGEVLDRVASYAGLRSVTLDGFACKINGKAVFQRQVLDQGYYPDGLMTAPSEEALVRDIELALEAGFNSARLHQKVFEERFLYHADRLGYLVWAEFGDWGVRQELGDVNAHAHQPAAALMAQWQEVLLRDYSHPSIVGWCPLNETGQDITDRIDSLDDLTHGLYWATKAADPTRPVLDTSGYAHRVRGADIYDSHDYEQDPEKFARNHAGLAEGKPFVNRGTSWSIPYGGQPYFVSEFGGIWWSATCKPGDASWGYGQHPADIEEFYRRFEGLCRTLLTDERMFGYCYTQLTDVFQEQNGIFAFDRSPKFDLARIRRIQAQYCRTPD